MSSPLLRLTDSSIARDAQHQRVLPLARGPGARAASVRRTRCQEQGGECVRVGEFAVILKGKAHRRL